MLLDAERSARASAELARGEAEASSRAKDEFLATVSHELRTPLNAMLGWSQLLTNNSLSNDELAHALEVIQRNVLAQSRLVEDLLDVSRIISGQMRLEVQPVNAVRVVGAAIESAKPAIGAKHIELDVSLDPDAGQVLGDANRVQQVIWNLLSNATKFTDQEGKISVRVRRVESSVEIAVSDTGPGLHEMKARPSLSTGVGLANIRERLAQAYGPDHRFESRSIPGGGFGVEIEIPFQLDEPVREVQ